MTTTHAAHLSLTAPDAQAFRAQLAFAAIKNANYPEAAELLIAAARAELDTAPDWAERAAELAQWCAGQCSAQRKALLAALLDLFGKRRGANAIDINAAVFLASAHLDRGHSAAKALAEGRKLLLSTVTLSTGRSAWGAASSGR
ncbi:hypothetical protein [Methylomonas sp. HYX-M1]|uniref:hypothetical protein n=1 Tax=Methylomonas sp. HYX-M1 TaxID=3139307 RepID=UPI00345B52A2